MRLVEEKKGDLVSQAKRSDNYKDTSKGKNRYDRRLKSKLASSVKHFNAIDMDKLFKSDILDVNIDVSGETNNYTVRLSFSGFLDELHNFLSTRGATDIDRKMIAQSLSRAFNSYDVYFNCSCPDFLYRHSWHATQKDNLIGDPQTRPIRKDVWHAGGIESSNYYGNQGPVCKHIVLALKDTSWIIRVASVIYNYINYMKDHLEREYQKYIYPAIYQEPYPEEEVQLDITDIEQEPTETEEGIDVSEYQEIVDDDLANNGGVLSTTTRALIDDAGLSLQKNSDGSYTVRANRLANTKSNVRRQELDKVNQLAREKGKFKPGNEFRFRKSTAPTSDQERIDFDKIGEEE